MSRASQLEIDPVVFVGGVLPLKNRKKLNLIFKTRIFLKILFFLKNTNKIKRKPKLKK